MENTLVMMVGLPRSGKTTRARELGHPIVNPDAIRLALHGQAFYADAEPMVWAIAKTMIRALFGAGHDTVILDATNTTRKRRDEWNSTGWKREYKEMHADRSICEKRAIADDMEILVPVIHRMADNFDPVEPEEWDGDYRYERG